MIARNDVETAVAILMYNPYKDLSIEYNMVYMCILIVYIYIYVCI